MERIFISQPPRRAGIYFQAALLVLFAAGGGLGLWRAFGAAMGVEFILLLIPAGLSLAAVPYLAYRLQALRNAVYIVERNGIQLQWGLRLVQIPMDRVDWVQAEEHLTGRLPRPWLYWPGAVLGLRRLPQVTLEYLAGRSANLLVIATPGRYYIISPAEPEQFLEACQRYLEMGVLAPLTPRSEQPAFLMARVWASRSARIYVLLGLGLNLLLLVVVSLVVPGRETIVLGFVPGAAAVPPVRLLLLPVVSGIFYFGDFLLGLFLFRRGLAEQQFSPPAGKNDRNGARRPLAPGELAPISSTFLAYLVWGSGVATALLFLLGAVFIFTAGG